MARQCRRQEERLRLRPRGRKGRPPCRTDSHGHELWEETEKAAGEATDGNGRKNGTRCDGKCSALQWATQRAEMTDAAYCICQATFPGNPEQSALISPPGYSSTQINQPSQRHRLSSTHLPAHVSSLTSTSYVLMKLILLPQPARSSSSACTLVFHGLHARLPQPARSAPPARTLVIRSQPNHTPNRPAPLHSFKQQGRHADVAQHAALAVMVSARQAPMRCGGEP